MRSSGSRSKIHPGVARESPAIGSAASGTKTPLKINVGPPLPEIFFGKEEKDWTLSLARVKLKVGKTKLATRTTMMFLDETPIGGAMSRALLKQLVRIVGISTVKLPWSDEALPYLSLASINDDRQQLSKALKELKTADLVYSVADKISLYDFKFEGGPSTADDGKLFLTSSNFVSPREDYPLNSFVSVSPALSQAVVSNVTPSHGIADAEICNAETAFYSWHTEDAFLSCDDLVLWTEYSARILTRVRKELGAELSRSLRLLTQIAHCLLLVSSFPKFLSQLFLLEEKWFFVHGTHPPDLSRWAVGGLSRMRGCSMSSAPC